MDVSSCRWRNVVFEANRVYLFLPSMKTDQNQQGTDVPLAMAEMIEHAQSERWPVGKGVAR